MSKKYVLPLYPGEYYHVYNRAVGNELLFYEEKNYSFFLQKYVTTISDFVETYSYCLVPNHYHLLVRIPDEPKDSGKIVSEKFRRFGISYTQSINKQEDRKGSLFMKPFKRKMIESNHQLHNLIYYIHFNSVRHGLVRYIEEYQWSSYHTILSNNQTWLERLKILDFFGGVQGFIDAHKHYSATI